MSCSWRSFLSPRPYFFRLSATDNFNAVAATDPAGRDNAAQDASPPAYVFLKALTNLVHQMARRAWFRDFQKRFADAYSLPQRQPHERDSATRDVFLGASRRNAEFVERLDVRHQDLPAAAAPSMQAVLEPFVFDGENFVEFADRLPVLNRLKQMQHFSHGMVLRQRAIW
jgi:hypothetical protein